VRVCLENEEKPCCHAEERSDEASSLTTPEAYAA
jgi:hypothetical protein